MYFIGGTAGVHPQGSNWFVRPEVVARLQAIVGALEAPPAYLQFNDASLQGGGSFSTEGPKPRYRSSSPSAPPSAPTRSGSTTGTVTADVNAMLAGQVPNGGWLLRKVDEGASGRLEIASRETGSGPRLLIELGNE